MLFLFLPFHKPTPSPLHESIMEEKVTQMLKMNQTGSKQLFTYPGFYAFQLCIVQNGFKHSF